jgi:putative transposase
MRGARIKADGAGYYHCMSRIIEGRYVLGEREKRRFLRNMRKLEAFCDLQILTYSVLDNHFHALICVPQRREVSDEELIRRLKFIYEPYQVKQIAQQLADLREKKLDAAAELYKARYTYRMYDMSEFFKTLKQTFSQWHNKRTDRRGPLWEQRYKSLLVEGSEHALATVGAYIDLNAVRAGIVEDPKDYRYCGYAEAVGGNKRARNGLKVLVQSLGTDAGWSQTRDLYRKHLYIQGQEKALDLDGRQIRRGFTKAQVEEVLRAGGKLPMHELLRCRVRYFSDGLVLGSREFVEETFDRYRAQFGENRRDGARRMQHADWGGLCTMRDLRLEPVSIG